MSLKAYDRKGQVWVIKHPSDMQTTFLVVGTQGRVKENKLIVYYALTSQEGRVWMATMADNLKFRWEVDSRMHRLV